MPTPTSRPRTARRRGRGRRRPGRQAPSSTPAPTTPGTASRAPATPSAGVRDVRGGAGALTRAVLAEYWIQAGVQQESTTRAMLAAYDDVTGGLDPGARALA